MALIAFGLAIEDHGSGPVHEYIKLFFALPYIPEEHISPFNRIKAGTTAQQQPLVDYIEQTWVSEHPWSPSNWCVYKRAICTNNDVEGWHNRLNTKAQQPNLLFYKLVSLLNAEASLVSIQHQPYQREQATPLFPEAEASIDAHAGQDVWTFEPLQREDLTTSQLLKQISYLAAPATH